MADNRYWRGLATAIAQVGTGTPNGTGIAEGDTWTMTLTDELGVEHALTYTSDATPTVAEVTAGLTALAASTATGDPEWAKVTVADGTTYVTVTANTAGVPFYLACTTAGGAGFALVATQANFGPNDYNTATNWLNGEVPVSTDTVYIDGNRSAILYGLDQVLVELVGFYVGSNSTVQIGDTNAYLKINTNAFEYAGVGISWIDIKDLQSQPVIRNAGRSTNYGRYGLNLNCTGTWHNDAKKVMIRLGSSAKSVGICAQYGESFTLTNIYHRGGTLAVGSALTTTSIYSQGGKLLLSKPPGTSLTAENTAIEWWAGVTFTLATLTGGSLKALIDAATISTLVIRGGAILDVSQLPGDELIISACEVYGSGTIKDPEGLVNWAAGIDLNQCNLSTVRLEIAPNKRITIGAVS